MDKPVEVLFVKVPSELKSALAALAERHERSLSGEVRYLLARELDEARAK